MTIPVCVDISDRCCRWRLSLQPDRARVRSNQALLALQHLGPQADAEAEMFKAHQVDPRDPGIVYALAVPYVQERKWDQALP